MTHYNFGCKFGASKNHNIILIMQIPINKLTKLLKLFPQCSAALAIPLLLYLIFISLILTISFPLKSNKSVLASAQNGNNFVNYINKLGDNEHKLLEKAKEIENVRNKSEILGNAFKQ